MIEANPVILHESKRLPFGIYAIVFFLAIHIAALVIEILRIEYGVVLGFLSKVGEIVIDQLGLGGMLGRMLQGYIPQVWINGVFILLLSVVIAGLLARQRWAWVTTMILIGISLLISIVHYFNDSPRYLNMMIGVAIVFYLNERSVQRVYEKRAKGEEIAL